MDTKQEDILMFDFKKKSKFIRILKTIFIQFAVFVAFILLSSYQNPAYRINGKLVDFNFLETQQLVELKLMSVILDSDINNIYDIDGQIKMLLAEFYDQRDYKPAWTTHFSVNNNFKSFIQVLDSMNYYGFPIDYFNKDKILIAQNEFEDKNSKNLILEKRIRLELLASYSVFKFMIYLNNGVTEKDTSMLFLSFLDSLPSKLNSALNERMLHKNIKALQPQLIQYKKIMASIPYFIDLKLSVENTTPKFINDSLLAKSLFYAGIIPVPVFVSEKERKEAIYKLQSKYNLPLESVLNKETKKVLMSNLNFRYYQACLNINRLRSLEKKTNDYLFVNIPEYKLEVVESNHIKDTFNVIVGTKWTPTPVFSSNIEKLVANPYWTVPKSISNKMLRRIRKDSTYLKRNGYFVIDNYENIVNDSLIDWSKNDPLGNQYWLRQKNSHINSLGKVKFIFPNDYRVFLHDTPNKKLFKRKNRTFSHGCVRLENPDVLAQYISDKFHKQKKLNIYSLISSNRREEIELCKKLEIHIQYITCTVGDDLNITFLDDIYKLDENEIKAMFPEQFEI